MRPSLAIALALAILPAVARADRRTDDLADARRAMSTALRALDWIGAVDFTRNTPATQCRLAVEAATCTASVDALLARGVPADVSVRVDGITSSEELTLGAARERLCRPLSTISGMFAAKVKQARSAPPRSRRR